MIIKHSVRKNRSTVGGTHEQEKELPESLFQIENTSLPSTHSTHNFPLLLDYA